MNNIHLRQTLPQVFADRDAITSDIWHQQITFSKGKSYLIEAASGTGKSSLCSYIYGYRRDYQGIINFDERNIRSLSVSEWGNIRRQSLSILFRNCAFSRTDSTRKRSSEEPADQSQEEERNHHPFRNHGIADKTNVKAGKLSFGQQQRVAFIRSLCQPFDFIFLDEPVSHLDDENGAIMSRLLTEEAGRQQAGIIVTSIGKHLPLAYNEVYKL